MKLLNFILFAVLIGSCCGWSGLNGWIFFNRWMRSNRYKADEHGNNNSSIINIKNQQEVIPKSANHPLQDVGTDDPPNSDGELKGDNLVTDSPIYGNLKNMSDSIVENDFLSSHHSASSSLVPAVQVLLVVAVCIFGIIVSSKNYL